MEQDIMAKIQASMPHFSKSQKRLAQAVLKEYDKIAYITAAKLGVMAGVSESTVVRFANELGFEGYPDFQHAVQELVRNKLTHNQRIEVSEQRIGRDDVLRKVMNADIEKMRATLENIDHTAFAQAVESILRARNIYILGVRSSASLASFLNFNLSLIFDNVKQVQPTSSSEVFEQLLSIGAEDVIFAISFPRYSSKVIHAVKFAREQHATVIALTDSPNAPIARDATHLLTAQSDMASFVDSLTAPLSIINAVLVAVAQGKREEIRERFNRLENVWDEYQVYVKQ
ncbi:MAG: MurR/RpiR family transcriptional regulator [Eubacteriales bacterium]